MKKGLLFGILSTVIFVSLFSAVSAANLGSSSQNLVDQVKSIVEPIAQFAFGGNLGWDALFVKVLLFIVLMMILVSALERMPLIGESNGVAWTIGVIIAILAMRLVTTDALLNFIWLPSGVMGMAMVTLLPLVIYFYFVETLPNRIVRRIAWILFAVMFVGLAMSRWSSLQSTEGVVGFNLAWMYVAVAGIALISFLIDGTIQRWMRQTKYERLSELKAAQMRSRIIRDERRLDEDVLSGLSRDSSDYKIRKEEIDRLKKHWGL